MSAGEIKIEIEGDVIVASLPGTSYRALFFLSPDKRRLIQAEQLSVNKEVPMYHEEFEAMAWEAANAKARELGWLVNWPPARLTDIKVLRLTDAPIRRPPVRCGL